MRDETTVPSGGALPPGVPPPGGPSGGVLPGGVLPAGVTAGRSAARGVTAGGVFRSRVPGLAGLRLGDLDRCGRARLATAARQIVTLGGDR